MRYYLLLLFTLIAPIARPQKGDSVMVRMIYDEVLANGQCYDRLRELCKGIGHRLAGSAQAERAIDWGRDAMIKSGFDTVYLQPVEVPRWIRGQSESAAYTTAGRRIDLPVAALGGSVGTSGELSARVIEARSLEELAQLGESRIRGKIVFLNKAMDPLLINTGAAYGGAYDIRSRGASEAARFGAVGCIIRSLTLAEDRYPHTGAMQYSEDVQRIPAAALSSVDARELSIALQADSSLVFHLNLHCEEFPRTIQYNVIGELRGSLFPDEYITVGGHLDSWDIGEGAHDDGCGIVQSMEVLRALRALGYRPRHTLRCVFFINEEFGNDGGETYAREARGKGEIHIAAIESDGGGFTPRGFSMQGTDYQYEWLRRLDSLLDPYHIHQFRRGWSGVDIAPLKDDRVALFGLLVDNQRYFDYHHSNNDVFEQVNRRELELGSAAMAALVYLIDRSGIPAQP
ncbi:MAG: M20/M25/M40 family metallo-hydrolase [Bacteroidota bacterium]